MRTAALITALAAGWAAADDPKLADGQKGFQGTWTIVSLERGGKKPDGPATAGTVVFDGDKYRIKAGDRTVEEGTFKPDATKTPNRIDVTVKAGEDKGKEWHGIYELEGDTLRAVVGPTDKARPERLTMPEPGTRGFTLKREKPAKP